MTTSQTEEIVLIPPTHEQSVYSFHVEEELVEPFLAFLQSHGMTPWRPPEDQNKTGPHGHRIVQVEVDTETSQGTLEGLVQMFLADKEA